MTPLTRPVTRRTAELHRGRPLVITLEEGGRLIRIREKGRRSSYAVTYTQVFYLGAQNRAAEIKREKLAARKAKKGQR